MVKFATFMTFELFLFIVGNFFRWDIYVSDAKSLQK